MQKSVIVSGEASETDSDNEAPSSIPSPAKSAIHGEVIKGEDSESEEEQASVTSAFAALGPIISTPISARKIEPNYYENDSKYDTLLHKKLFECNRYLHEQISQFSQYNMTDAAKSLTDVEQQLLQSQLTLEGAITSLRCLNVNSIAIRNKLKHVLEGDFLNTIKTDK